jgi:hypothetical protein
VLRRHGKVWGQRQGAEGGCRMCLNRLSLMQVKPSGFLQVY